MLVKKTLIALFAVSAPFAALQAQPTGTDSPATETPANETAPAAQNAERPAPAAERRICRRLDTTGSRTGGQRVCMTAAEWRRADQ